MIPSSLYIKVYIWSYDQKYHKFSYYFPYKYFSSLNLKYLKFTKLDITRFAMKLFIFSLNLCTIFQGNMLDLPQDEDTPEKRVNKIFTQMDTVRLCFTPGPHTYHIKGVLIRVKTKKYYFFF